MGRTTASYKMKYDVAKTMEKNTIEQLQACPFSINVDESTNNANKTHSQYLGFVFWWRICLVVVQYLLSLDKMQRK